MIMRAGGYFIPPSPWVTTALRQGGGDEGPPSESSSENFNDIANGSWLKDDANWSDWDLAAWGVSSDILVENIPGNSGNPYVGDMRAGGGGGRAASFDGGHTFSDGVGDWYFRMLNNNGDYAVGVWITDGTLTNRIMCTQTPAAGGSGIGYELAMVTGGTLHFDTIWGSPPNNTWVWWRLRCDWENETVKCKVWTGDIGDEPEAWTQEETEALPVGVNLRLLSSATTAQGNCKWDDISELWLDTAP